MTELDKILKMLKSPKADTRYDACETLRVAIGSSPEVIAALEEAAQDEDEYVAERARLALDAEVHQRMARKMRGGLPIVEEPVLRGRSLMDELDPGDTAYAVGKVRRKLDEFLFIDESTGLLVRTADGSYYVMDEDAPGRTEIRAVIDRTIVGREVKSSRVYVGLMTNSGVIGFYPIEMFPEKAIRIWLFPNVDADFLLSRIKELGELATLQQCPVCGVTRPVDVPQCSNPTCPTLNASVETSSQSSGAAIPSCFCGGSLGALAGFLLFLLVYAIAWKLNVPPELRARLQEYRWVLPAVLAVVGTYGLFFFLERSAQKDASQGVKQ